MSGASSGTGIGQRAAENRERAREDELRRRREPAAALEQQPCRIEIDAHADVEIGFGLSAHDGGEMEDGVGIRGDRALDDRRIGEIAGHAAHARIAEVRRWDDVEQHEFADGSRARRGRRSASRATGSRGRGGRRGNRRRR